MLYNKVTPNPYLLGRKEWYSVKQQKNTFIGEDLSVDKLSPFLLLPLLLITYASPMALSRPQNMNIDNEVTYTLKSQSVSNNKYYIL